MKAITPAIKFLLELGALSILKIGAASRIRQRRIRMLQEVPRHGTTDGGKAWSRIPLADTLVSDQANRQNGGVGAVLVERKGRRGIKAQARPRRPRRNGRSAPWRVRLPGAGGAGGWGDEPGEPGRSTAAGAVHHEVPRDFPPGRDSRTGSLGNVRRQNSYGKNF